MSGRFETRGRRCVVALFGGHGAETVPCLCHADVLRPERRPPADERLLEQTLRLVEDPNAAIHPPHHRQNLGLGVWLSHKLILHALGAVMGRITR